MNHIRSMNSLYSNPELSKSVEEDGAGCGDCRDRKDAPESSRSTDGPRVDGSLPFPPVLTHLSVALCILNTKAGGTKVQEFIGFLMDEKFDLSEFRFYLHSNGQCFRNSENVAKQTVSNYFRVQDK